MLLHASKRVLGAPSRPVAGPAPSVTVAGEAPRTPVGRPLPPRRPPGTVGQPRGGPKVTNRRAVFDLAMQGDLLHLLRWQPTWRLVVGRARKGRTRPKRQDMLNVRGHVGDWGSNPTEKEKKIQDLLRCAVDAHQNSPKALKAVGSSLSKAQEPEFFYLFHTRLFEKKRFREFVSQFVD